MSNLTPHWHLPHHGEHRFPVSLVVVIVITLQFLLPGNLSLNSQKFICVVEFSLLLLLYALSPTGIKRHHPPARAIGFILTSVMTISNTASAIKLVLELISGGIGTATQLLVSGGSIGLTNIVIFSLWFWDLDRGGPGARAEAKKVSPDFLFPQMSDPLFAAPGWHPKFFDYLYMSFTNASAFSPTDVMPLSRWAKMLMLLQSTTSLVVVGLVVARAVNILH